VSEIPKRAPRDDLAENLRRPASPADLDRIVRETPVDAQWADELARMRAEDEDAAADPWMV